MAVLASLFDPREEEDVVVGGKAEDPRMSPSRSIS
jgi:hypothetical protein